MFLHETTLLVYPASVTYDGTPLSWQCDIGLRLEYDFYHVLKETELSVLYLPDKEKIIK